MVLSNVPRYMLALASFGYFGTLQPSGGAEITIFGTCTVGNFGCHPSAQVTFSVSNGVARGQFSTSSALLGSGCSGTNICNPTYTPTVNGGTFILPKCNKSLRATFECSGTTTPDCSSTCTVDPFFTTLAINTGHSVAQSFDDIPKPEHLINITNGEPGLEVVSIRINGKDFRRFHLDNSGSNINIDASSAMNEERNTITFIGRGHLGAFANIVVGVAPPPTARSVANTVFGRAEKIGIWGPLVDSTEDNAIEEVAIAATQQIQLTLATSLDLSSATTASRYAVTANGVSVTNIQIGANPVRDGTALILRLPTRSIKVGDAIQVVWSGLKDSGGQLISGNVDLIAQ